ncbi:MAG: hypothetical protein HFI86_02545 [Bacilli bacterium]|nr:hypothetical protein [Bacilli bacterium]
MDKIKNVKSIKQLIDKVMLPNYNYKTSFNSPDFLIDINPQFIIHAKPKCLNDRVVYEFVLDTQFLSNKEISYSELKMINNIINILEDNRKFVLSKFKKYTINEYKEEIRIREERSQLMMESLKKIIIGNMK